jgi:hypothetical protein
MIENSACEPQKRSRDCCPLSLSLFYFALLRRFRPLQYQQVPRHSLHDVVMMVDWIVFQKLDRSERDRSTRAIFPGCTPLRIFISRRSPRSRQPSTLVDKKRRGKRSPAHPPAPLNECFLSKGPLFYKTAALSVS